MTVFHILFDFFFKQTYFSHQNQLKYFLCAKLREAGGSVAIFMVMTARQQPIMDVHDNKQKNVHKTTNANS